VMVICAVEQSDQRTSIADDHSPGRPSSRRRISSERSPRS
jgi:hypothetical protein